MAMRRVWQHGGGLNTGSAVFDQSANQAVLRLRIFFRNIGFENRIVSAMQASYGEPSVRSEWCWQCCDGDGGESQHRSFLRTHICTSAIHEIGTNIAPML